MSQRTIPQIARFGVFEVDLLSHELRKRGIKVKLHEQPFQVLATLLEHPREVVSREELRRRIWPSDTFVDFDNGLNGAVNRLREALGDSADSPRFVETVPRQGYRFIAALEDVAPVVGPGVLPNGAGHGEAASPGKSPNDLPRVARALQPRVWGLTSLVVVGLALLTWNLVSRRHEALGITAPPKIRSLAVLPLENLSGDPGQEYFADGMTDALINDLAQISSLKVISRTSVMRYKSTRKTLPEISKELNVDGIVEGTVIRSPERMRVDVQVIEAKSNEPFWARSYERNVGDAVALQTDLAQAIANEIQAKLTPQEQARLQRTESVDPQTYELYLRGRYIWNNQTDVARQKSIEYFQQAIQRSPHYAPAYAAIAEAYVVRLDLSPKEASSKAKAAARAALQLDDTLANAHSALAASLFWYDWDWAGAEKEFQRALALNPNYARAHQWYAQYLIAMGRRDLAVEELKRAEQLDPLALNIAGGSGRYGKQYDLMLEHARKMLELYPDNPRPYISLGKAYRLKGMYPDAIAAYQKARDLSGGDPDALPGLGYTYAVWGERAEALKILGELKAQSKRRYIPPSSIAMIYVGLGEKDEAFDWLQKAVTDHDINLLLVTRGEEWGSLRSDPRYPELLNRIGLPQ